jgi:hypothetical protein
MRDMITEFETGLDGDEKRSEPDPEPNDPQDQQELGGGEDKNMGENPMLKSDFPVLPRAQITMLNSTRLLRRQDLSLEMVLAAPDQPLVLPGKILEPHAVSQSGQTRPKFRGLGDSPTVPSARSKVFRGM